MTTKEPSTSATTEMGSGSELDTSLEQELADGEELASSRRRRDRTRTYVGAIPPGGIDLDVDLVPEVAMEPTQVAWHTLDHRAGYLLRQVDGQRSCRDIIDSSGIDPLQARGLLAYLLQQGCIRLSEPPTAPE